MVEERESEPPLLLINYGKWLQNYLIYSASENRFRILNNIPELHNVKVAGSSYGWMFLADPDTQICCLFNPTSRDIIRLPDDKYGGLHRAFVLTKPPTEPDCQVFLSSTWDQAFCRIGDSEFVKNTGSACAMMATVSFQGQIYGFMGPNPEFVTIHCVDKTLEFRPVLLMNENGSCPWLIPHSSLSYSIWLMEYSSNELLMIQKIFLSWKLKGGLDFRIFRVDTNLKRCIEVENIGDRTILLGHDGGGYCCRSIRVKPNSIYYTNEPQLGDRNVNIFDLEDKSVISLLPSRIVGHKSLTAAWVHGITL